MRHINGFFFGGGGGQNGAFWGGGPKVDVLFLSLKGGGLKLAVLWKEIKLLHDA